MNLAPLPELGDNEKARRVSPPGWIRLEAFWLQLIVVTALTPDSYNGIKYEGGHHVSQA